MKLKNLVPFIVAGVLALGVGVLFGYYQEHGEHRALPVQLKTGTAMLNSHRPVPAFSLTWDDGKPFTNADLKGKWSFLFFGYTHCPDICPTTLLALNQGIKAIEKRGDAADTEVVFISVDPKRDSLPVLKKYVTYFNPGFLAATGPMDHIDALTKPLGILHKIVPNPASKNPNDYLVDHSASIVVVSPNGDVAAMLRGAHDPKAFAADFHTLRTAYQNE